MRTSPGYLLRAFAIGVVAAATSLALADDAPPPKTNPDGSVTVAAGHSTHGEIFDEGPRQRAYLMEGTGPIEFPITTTSPEAQQFFLQGIGQLHGFWYFEAERSFRQAAALDPKCAMAYWGMAQANLGNDKRASGFVAKAVENIAGVSRLEKLWIEALRALIPEKKADVKPAAANTNTASTTNTASNNRTAEQARKRKFVKDLEAIVDEFPEHLEAKALLVKQIWLNSQDGIPISSHIAVDALIGEVLAKQPMHPVHHYRIHLWDHEKAKRALTSAALCGQSAPTIAHMWHMPGHTYSELKRYADAAWQQEASSRVDHAHMIHDRVLPDQIHNYAHNQDWLAKNLTYVGRVHDSISLAKNLIELPRHPKYNVQGVKGAARYGRTRLIDTLVRFELWDELIALAETNYLEPTDQQSEQIRRLKALGTAFFAKGDLDRGGQQIAKLEEMLAKLRSERTAAGDKAETQARSRNEPDDKVAKAMADALVPFNNRMKPIDTALAELAGHQAVAKKEWSVAWEKFKGSDGKEALSRARLEAGDKAEAEKLAREAVERGPGEFYPLANQVDILYRAGKTTEAAAAFERLRPLAAQLDLDLPIAARLKPVAESLKLAADWRIVKPAAGDVGVRPELGSLGPFRWHPSPAPEWKLTSADGQTISLAQYRGKPVLAIFYLGVGCLHCIEQLKAFAPLAKDYEAAGITLIGISSDDLATLTKSVKEPKPNDPKVTFPLVSNSSMDVFRAYRTFDDFEDLPLHGTFLIDGDGLVRWQDISFEPFTDARFLLNEARRLLASDKPSAVPSPPVTASAGGN